MKRAYCTAQRIVEAEALRGTRSTSLAWMSIGMNSSTGSPASRTIAKTAVSERKTTSAVWARRDAR